MSKAGLVGVDGKQIQREPVGVRLFNKLKDNPNDRAFRLTREDCEELLMEALSRGRLLQMAVGQVEFLNKKLMEVMAPNEDVKESDQSEESSS